MFCVWSSSVIVNSVNVNFGYCKQKIFPCSVLAIAKPCPRLFTTFHKKLCVNTYKPYTYGHSKLCVPNSTLSWEKFRWGIIRIRNQLRGPISPLLITNSFPWNFIHSWAHWRDMTIIFQLVLDRTLPTAMTNAWNFRTLVLSINAAMEFAWNQSVVRCTKNATLIQEKDERKTFFDLCLWVFNIDKVLFLCLKIGSKVQYYNTMLVKPFWARWEETQRWKWLPAIFIFLCTSVGNLRRRRKKTN